MTPELIEEVVNAWNKSSSKASAEDVIINTLGVKKTTLYRMLMLLRKRGVDVKLFTPGRKPGTVSDAVDAFIAKRSL